MPKQNLTLAGLLLSLALFAGCETWLPGGAVATDKKGAFTVRAPSGWMYATAFSQDFVASKDGPTLQQIWVQHHELKEALPHSKRVLTSSLQPFEVAEAVADDLKANHELLNFEVVENTPATVGGQPGFKLTFAFHTAEKLRLSETMYGCISGGNLWLIRYRAPSRYYFERDGATFAETVKTFQFAKK